MRDKLFTAFKVLISLGLIVYLFTRIDLAEVKTALASANYLYLALALILYFGAIALNVYKWGYLLRTQGLAVPFINLLSHTLVGLFFANLPLSQVMGDIARGVDRSACWLGFLSICFGGDVGPCRFLMGTR